MNKTRIHALQYLLVGLALCLFYSLLLSFSEHVGFNPAYLLSSALTIMLVGGYMFGITKKKKPVINHVRFVGYTLYLYLCAYPTGDFRIIGRQLRAVYHSDNSDVFFKENRLV